MINKSVNSISTLLWYELKKVELMNLYIKNHKWICHLQLPNKSKPKCYVAYLLPS